MYIHNRLETKSNFLQKIVKLDYILLFCIFILGILSIATMYSTDGGQILFYTKSHFIKFIIFSTLMLVIAFFNIRFWFSLSYLFYLVLVLCDLDYKFWNYCIWLTKVDEFIFYKYSAIRINENSYNSLLSKILSSNEIRKCKFILFRHNFFNNYFYTNESSNHSTRSWNIYFNIYQRNNCLMV